jgi:hypothetical protein
MIAPSHQLNVNPFNEGVQLINSTRGRRLLSQFTQYRSSVELVELFGSLVLMVALMDPQELVDIWIQVGVGKAG